MAEDPPIDYIALAQQAADQGPIPSPPSTLYFTYLRTDGDSFIAPATNSVVYLRKGYTITGEQTIENLVAWNEEQSVATAAKAPAAKESTSETAHSSRAAHTAA